MTIRCKILGHDTIDGLWVDVDKRVALPTTMCRRCSYTAVDLDRYVEHVADPA